MKICIWLFRLSTILLSELKKEKYFYRNQCKNYFKIDEKGSNLNLIFFFTWSKRYFSHMYSVIVTISRVLIMKVTRSFAVPRDFSRNRFYVWYLLNCLLYLIVFDFKMIKKKMNPYWQSILLPSHLLFEIVSFTTINLDWNHYNGN